MDWLKKRQTNLRLPIWLRGALKWEAAARDISVNKLVEDILTGILSNGDPDSYREEMIKLFGKHRIDMGAD